MSRIVCKGAAEMRRIHSSAHGYSKEHVGASSSNQSHAKWPPIRRGCEKICKVLVSKFDFRGAKGGNPGTTVCRPTEDRT
jgi:hypothetical protein